MIAPMPTAPIGAASPNWPTTPVSTAPRMGTVTLASTMGRAMPRTLRCVTGTRAVSVILSGHEEMARGLGKGARAVVLPRLDLDRGIAPPGPRDLRARIGIARQTRAQVIDREIDRLGQSRQLPGNKLFGVEAVILDSLPEHGPAQPDDRRDLEKGRRRPAVQGWQVRITDQAFLEWHDSGQLIPAAIEHDPQKTDIGHAIHQCVQRGIAALLDHLDGFGPGAAHDLASTVKAPVAVATGRVSSSSIARARTKATDRVMW